MENYLVKDMTLAIAEALHLRENATQVVYDTLKNFWACSIVHIWGADDVIDAAEFHLDESYILTVEQAMEILQAIDHDLDNSEGVSWQTIEDEISYYVRTNNIQPVEDDGEEN